MRDNSSEAAPLYQRLAGALQARIEGGDLRPGERLPSVRALHRESQAAITTVLAAYALLEDRGLIEARPQSGYFVSSRLPSRLLAPKPSVLPSAGAQGPRTPIDELVLSSFIAATQRPELVQLAESTPCPDLLPTKHLLRLLGRASRQRKAELILFEHPQGNPELRRQIARRAMASRLAEGPDDIVVTNGGMESWNLCLRALLRPGDTVLLQVPTHFAVPEILANLGLHGVPLPEHPVHGVDVAATRALVEKGARALFLLPQFGHPLGVTLSEEAKAGLVKLAAEARVPILEDDLYGELPFGEERRVPLKAFDREGWVLHCASFSKNVAPGFRVAWISPGRFREAVLRLKFISSISAPTLQQHVLAEFLALGAYDRHLRRARRVLSTRWVSYARAIADAFPADTRLAPPSGGHAFWVMLPERVDTLRLYRKALERGIAVAPGAIYAPTGAPRDFERAIRISFAAEPTPKVLAALALVGKLALSQLTPAAAQGRPE